jgi:hypothetical protein
MMPCSKIILGELFGGGGGQKLFSGHKPVKLKVKKIFLDIKQFDQRS